MHIWTAGNPTPDCLHLSGEGSRQWAPRGSAHQQHLERHVVDSYPGASGPDGIRNNHPATGVKAETPERQRKWALM